MRCLQPTVSLIRVVETVVMRRSCDWCVNSKLERLIVTVRVGRGQWSIAPRNMAGMHTNFPFDRPEFNSDFVLLSRTVRPSILYDEMDVWGPIPYFQFGAYIVFSRNRPVILPTCSLHISRPASERSASFKNLCLVPPSRHRPAPHLTLSFVLSAEKWPTEIVPWCFP